MSGPGGGFGTPPGGGAFGYPPPSPPGGGFGAPATPPAPHPPQPPKKKDTSKRVFLLLIAGAVLFALVSCCGLLIFAGIQGQRDQRQFAALGDACDGRPVAGTQPHPAPHPRLRVMERRSAGGWRMNLLLAPDDYEARDLADVSVVLCMEEAREVVLDECDFVETMWGIDVPNSEHTFPRTAQRVDVRLVAAATGAVIATGEVQGRVPSCDEWSGDTPSESDFEGEDVERADVRDWVRQQLPIP